ncbi:hypothetical protein KEJ25_05100 [Candidatus Bathyarchaeota archaeon]|nr:hypothetical protein [Candidatus Bathyarchaeota archaeon]
MVHVKGENMVQVLLEVFPTGLCGCGRRREENEKLFALLRETKKDFGERVEIRVAEYGEKLLETQKRLAEILEASGKKRVVEMGLGPQVMRSLIPIIAINGKIAFVTSVPGKEELYERIRAAF